MILDKLGKEIVKGQTVVYPARPGGKGPLQLVKATVHDVVHSLNEVDVVVEGSDRVIAIARTDRLAIVNE